MPIALIAQRRRCYSAFTPSAQAALTGTVTTATEANIVSGGKTIILTLTNDTWVASGATFDAQRQNIINGCTASSSPTDGWNDEVKSTMVVGNVVRTSATVVTITLPAVAGYSISDGETVTVTIPSTALTSGQTLVASPTFAITADSTSWILENSWDTSPAYPTVPSPWSVGGIHGSATWTDSSGATRATMADNFPSGVGAGTLEVSGGNHKWFRMDADYLLSANFYGNPVNWKLSEFILNGGNHYIPALRGATSDPLFLRAALQGCTNLTGVVAVVGSWAGDMTGGNADQSAVETPRNTLVNISARGILNSASTADGQLKIYQDDVLVLHCTTINWANTPTVDAYQLMVLINGGGAGEPTVGVTYAQIKNRRTYYADSDPGDF